MTAGYRVVATLSSATQKNLKTYLDWIFVGHGTGVTQIVGQQLRSRSRPSTSTRWRARVADRPSGRRLLPTA